MMKFFVFVLLSLLLLVKGAFADFQVRSLCSEEECGCKRPKDPQGISMRFTEKYSIHYGCVCLCGCLRGEECSVDEDCVEGFECHPVGRQSRRNPQRKACLCPCDDVQDPYCPSPYSHCSMNGTTPNCNCHVSYRCKEDIFIPKCVIWGDDTVYEYRNPCFFVTESCHKTRNDLRWLDYPYGCQHVQNLRENLVHSYVSSPGKIEYRISGSALALVGWDPSTNGNLGMPDMYMRPEPEPEPELPSFL